MTRIIDDEYAGTNIIGLNVRKFRKEQKLSQKKLSNRLELMGVYICRGSISRIENQCRTVTDIELEGLAKALNVPISDLFSTCTHVDPNTGKSTLKLDKKKAGVIKCTRCGQTFELQN